MDRQMFFTVWCVLNFGLLNPTDSELLLLVSPDTIGVELTRSLNISCTFSPTSPTNISYLISLVVSKTDDHQNATPVYQELASIHEFVPDQVNTFPALTASVSGLISTGKTSYLNLQWEYPNLSVAGIYLCKALGVDGVGHPVEEDHTKQVTASKPDIDQLIEVIKLQQKQIDNMMRVQAGLNISLADVSMLTNEVSTLNSNFSTLTNTLTSNVSTLTNNVSTLTSNFSTLTNNVSTLSSDVNQVSEEIKELNKTQDISLTTLAKFYIKSSNYQGRYYLLSKEDADTNREAQASCLLQGGYLAEINDISEHNFIKTFLGSSSPSRINSVLVGATEIEHPGTWVFSHSHQVVNYTDWTANQPRDDNYACMILSRGDGWSMYNDRCSYYNYKYSFLCEIPIV